MGYQPFAGPNLKGTNQFVSVQTFDHTPDTYFLSDTSRSIMVYFEIGPNALLTAFAHIDSKLAGSPFHVAGKRKG